MRTLDNQVVHDLENQVVHHKSEIRRHREAIRWKAEAIQRKAWTPEQLAEFEAKCRRFGIKVITTTAGVEGDLHGPDHDSE